MMALKKVHLVAFSGTLSLSLQPFAAGMPVLDGSAVLERATRATLSKNAQTEARFSSSSDSAVLDWSKFNVPQGGTLGFDGSGTTFFNLVAASAGRSQIDGMINGSGNVWVINPSGVAFGAHSSVNVGGLFAAAAGNLSNEQAIRDGTSLVPSFSSFDGRVDVEGGAKFTADQVALLGKGVSAAGDVAYVDQLTIGSADKLVVDEVAGGRISVSVSDFATGGAIELGDLLVGGDVKAVARGAVTATGEAYALGNVQLFSKAGDVTVASGATVETLGTGAEVDLVAGMSDGATGAVRVDGTVRADAGEVYMHAGYGTGSSGSMTVNGTVSAGGTATVLAGNYYGDGNNVTVSGAVSAGGVATVSSYDGSVALSGGQVTGGDGVAVCAFAGVSGTGAIDASGKTLSVNGGIGNIVLDGVTIKAKDATLTADDYFAYFGSDYAGAVSAKNAANDFTGMVTARGTSVTVLDANDLALGDVKAHVGGVTAYSGNGDVSVVKGASVQSAGTVDLTAGMGTGAAGSVRVTGDVSSSGGDVCLYSGYGSGASGDVTIDGDVTAAGTVDAYAGFGYAQGTGGKLSVNGNVTGGTVCLRTGNGDIAIGGDAVVKSDAACYGSVSVYTAADAGYGMLDGTGHSGNITVDGTLKADGIYGTVDVVAGKEVGATGSVTLNGTVASDYYSELATRTGDIIVNGSASSLGNVSLNGESGNITVSKGAEVTSMGGSQGIRQDVLGGWVEDESHAVNMLAAMDAAGQGDVVVDGSVSARGDLGFVGMSVGRDGRTGEKTGGSGGIRVGGSVEASGDVVMSAKEGSVSVTGGGSVRSSSGTFAVTSGKGVAIDGMAVAKDVDVDALGGLVSLGAEGRVAASGSLALWGDEGVAGAGTVDASGAVLEVSGGSGQISLTGVVKARDATFSTRGYADVGALDSDVAVDNPGNDFTGMVVAEGKNVSLADANDMTLGTVYASGKLDVSAGGGVAQQAGSLIVAGGGDLPVSLSAEGGIVLANAGNRFKGVVSARGESVKLTDAGSVTLGEVEAGSGSVEVNSVAGGILLSGDVKASDDVTLTAKGDVSGRDSVTAGGDLEVGSAEGGIVLNGVLKVKDVRANAAKYVSLVNEGNVFAGKIAVQGAGVGVQAGSDVRIETAEARDGNVNVVTVDGGVTLVSGGTASGKIVNLKSGRGDVAVGGTVAATEGVTLETTGLGDVRVSGEVTGGRLVQGLAAAGAVIVAPDAVVRAVEADGTVKLAAATAAGAEGRVNVEGSVAAQKLVSVVSGEGAGSHGDVCVSGTVAAEGAVLIMAGYAHDEATGASLASGDTTVSGTVTAGQDVIVGTGDGDVRLTGRVSATARDGQVTLAGGIYNGKRGNVRVDGTVSSSGDAFVMTGASGKAPGGITFGRDGSVVASENAFLVTSARGDIVQEGVSVPAAEKGAVARAMLPAAVSAETVNVKVNGSLGRGGEAPVAVSGKIFGYASGDASVAAANGQTLQGGENPGEVVTDYQKIDWANMDASSTLEAGGDLFVYAPGGISHYGNFLAGGDIVLSASSMGDMSYLRAGGTLHVNNVGKPASPLLAYFETVNGKTPKIDNQPNDVVVFVDGRLAGGNIQTMNRLGSHEAFPVETPELKSVQGVFGNPNFLHGELDVSEPVGIGVIDYLLVDRAKMSYGADIPPEMDMQVAVNGLSPLYSYWFGQRAAKTVNESERKSRKGVVTTE